MGLNAIHKQMTLKLLTLILTTQDLSPTAYLTSTLEYLGASPQQVQNKTPDSALPNLKLPFLQSLHLSKWHLQPPSSS